MKKCHMLSQAAVTFNAHWYKTVVLSLLVIITIAVIIIDPITAYVSC